MAPWDGWGAALIVHGDLGGYAVAIAAPTGAAKPDALRGESSAATGEFLNNLHANQYGDNKRRRVFWGSAPGASAARLERTLNDAPGCQKLMAAGWL